MGILIYFAFITGVFISATIYAALSIQYILNVFHFPTACRCPGGAIINLECQLQLYERPGHLWGNTMAVPFCHTLCVCVSYWISAFCHCPLTIITCHLVFASSLPPRLRAVKSPLYSPGARPVEFGLSLLKNNE